MGREMPTQTRLVSFGHHFLSAPTSLCYFRTAVDLEAPSDSRYTSLNEAEANRQARACMERNTLLH
jgi:hypothetical protein